MSVGFKLGLAGNEAGPRPNDDPVGGAERVVARVLAWRILASFASIAVIFASVLSV